MKAGLIPWHSCEATTPCCYAPHLTGTFNWCQVSKTFRVRIPWGHSSLLPYLPTLCDFLTDVYPPRGDFSAFIHHLDPHAPYTAGRCGVSDSQALQASVPGSWAELREARLLSPFFTPLPVIVRTSPFPTPSSTFS